VECGTPTASRVHSSGNGAGREVISKLGGECKILHGVILRRPGDVFDDWRSGASDASLTSPRLALAWTAEADVFVHSTPQNVNFSANWIRRGGSAARMWLNVGELMSLSGRRKFV
jgi:hypothetical protein